MTAPEGLLFTPDHEWLAPAGDNTYRLGISDYAQDQLGDIVYVDLPEVAATFEKGALLSEVESTKSVGEVLAPVPCTVVEANGALDSAPETINADPYGDGWIVLVEVAPDTDMSHLLDEAAYLASLDA